MTNNKFKYQCTNCNTEYTSDKVLYLCEACKKLNTSILPPKGVLKVVYNYAELLKDGITFDSLKQNSFIQLLPLKSSSSLPNLKVGNTPLYKINKLNNNELAFNLYLKDDSQNPTYSFKDRASSIVSAFAKENKISTIVAASTGNAGSSLAGICASQQQNAIIIVPEKAPIAKLTQILMYGAKIVPVAGTYDDAFDLSMMATNEFGWYNRNTAFNPFTIEGKKTVSFELFEQLNFDIPDIIFVPVGDGAIISGVYKGFEDLLKLKIIKKMPIIVAVQAEKSNNLIRNIKNSSFQIVESDTIADSISVNIPRNFYMTRNFIVQYNGEILNVTDDEILSASATLSKNTGLFVEPAAAAAFAGMLAYKNKNKIPAHSKVVVLLTGSGLKDLKAVRNTITMPKAISPTISELRNITK